MGGAALEESAVKTVVVGLKPLMNYVVACLTLFNEGEETILIRARGKHISKAVEAVTLLRNTFVPKLRVVKAMTKTDKLTRRDGKPALVSVLEIQVSKE